MIELHSHTTLSDGELIPAELVRRAEVEGVRAICITDHGDGGLIEWSIPILVRLAEQYAASGGIKIVPGVELTHCRVEHLKELVARSRRLGAKLVTCHGETIVEPVVAGTNRAAILAGVDVLAHPGLISPADVRLAAKRGVCLEISGRRGHCLTNGHVAAMARRYGAKLVFGSDAHAASDLHTREAAERVLKGAGLRSNEVRGVFKESERLADLI